MSSLNTSIMLHASKEHIVLERMIEHHTLMLKFSDGGTTVTVFLKPADALHCAHLLHAEVYEFDKEKSLPVSAEVVAPADDEIPF